MSDIELAIERTKLLESLLESALGASGRGLHEKTDSVQAKLAQPLIRKLHFIATIRNKIVHESDYTQIDDRPRFIAACEEAEGELRALLPAAPRKGCFFAFLVFAGILASAVEAI